MPYHNIEDLKYIQGLISELIKYKESEEPEEQETTAPTTRRSLLAKAKSFTTHRRPYTPNRKLRNKTQKRVDVILEMSKQGLTDGEIAKKLKMDVRALYNYRYRHKIPRGAGK